MTLDNATLTRTASETALLASGRWPVVSQSITDGVASSVLLIDPYDRPTPSDAGLLCPDTMAALARVVFHEDPTARTVYLTIDRDNAPLTGNYVVQIDALTAVTYDATSAAPADVDALIAGIVAAIVGDAPTAAVVTATAYAMESGGDLDAIKLVAVTADLTTYTDFIIGASTQFPALADLIAVREITDAQVKIWTRPAHTVDASVVATAPYAAMLSAWTVARDVGAIIVTDDGGYAERLDLSGMAACWIQLYDVTTPSDGTITDGAYVDKVLAYIAPAQTSP